MEISKISENKLTDDSAILYSPTDPAVIFKKLGAELKLCSKWLVDNQLSLHIVKTECDHFGSRRKLRRVDYFYIECNGHTITTQSSVKYLGLNLDNHKQLTGETIVNNIVKKVIPV